MIHFLSSEILSVLIVISLYIDLMAVRSSTEHKRDRFMRRASLLSMITILNGIAMTMIIHGYGSFLPDALVVSIRSIQLISFPLMVFLWSHFILFSLEIDTSRYRTLTLFTINLLIVFSLIVFIDLSHQQLFIYDGSHRPRGLGITVMTVLCIGYSLIALLTLLRNYRRLSKDRFFALAGLPIMHIFSVIVYQQFGSHQTFTISQALTVFSLFLVMQNRRLRYDSLTGLACVQTCSQFRVE
mgnify:CR=1 FL=1